MNELQKKIKRQTSEFRLIPHPLTLPNRPHGEQSTFWMILQSSARFKSSSVSQIVESDHTAALDRSIRHESHGSNSTTRAAPTGCFFILNTWGNVDVGRSWPLLTPSRTFPRTLSTGSHHADMSLVVSLVLNSLLVGLVAAKRLRSTQTIVASRREGTHPGWIISEFEVHPSVPLKFTIHLKQEGLDELHETFTAVSDPSNPRYGW